MANLEELLQQALMSDEEQTKLGLSGYFANELGDVGGALNSDYSQAMQYQDMVRQNSMPQEVLKYNDIPLDQDPFQAYGGRISTGIPMGYGESLNLGLSANAFNNPYFKQSLTPTGVDATYQSGNTGYGVSYEQLSPDQKKLLFSIFREF